MVAAKIEQGTILILDIGKNVSCPDEKNEKSFFEKARDCTARIIERIIMSQGKSLVGVILLGSKNTNNNMAEQCDGAFKHIDTFAELQEPTWKIIRDLPDTATKSKGDWLESLIVAADHFKNGVAENQYKILNKKIIIMTNFMYLTELEDNVDQVLNGLKGDGIEVDVIGPDLFETNEKSDLELAAKFIDATDGVTATFDSTMQYLLFHKKKAVNPWPWNVDLSIGPNIRIPVSAYIRLKDEPVVKKWMTAIKDPVTAVASTNKGIMTDKVYVNTEDQTPIESEDIIKGYYYGQKLVPLSEYEKTMLYESGPKCMSVYGFTHATNINWQNLTGDGLSYVFGRKGDVKAQHAITCLAQCLHELNLVGIVRRVYNNNNAPKMYALMPVIDPNNLCLAMINICFKEDIKHMAFPVTNLKKYKCTDEQVDAFKDLIRAMDLTKAYDETFDDTEAFPIAETVSPSAQYILDCIAFRAMNPGKPLPPPRDEIMMLFKQPPLIEKRAREPLEKLMKLLTLNKVEVKKRYQKKTEEIDAELMKPPADLPIKYQKNDMPKVNLPKNENEIVNRIGTVDPVNDFKTLLSKGKSLPEIKAEMSEAIESLFYHSLDEKYTKALDAMSCFRTKCVKSDPAPYNEWLQKFKVDLSDRKKNNVLDIIAENKLSFILKEENKSSTYEQEDSNESQLYENDTVPDSIDLSLQSDINDMFDDM